MDGQAGAEADPYACAEGKEPGAEGKWRDPDGPVTGCIAKLCPQDD